MLEAVSLNAYYDESHVLHDLDFAIAEGERVAVLGRNGAGKSTFLKSLMNAGPRTTGDICFEGSSLAGMPAFRRARLGLTLVPEDRRIYTHLTVEENLQIARYAAGTRRPVEAESVISSFSMLGPLVKRYGGQLSGGQQQILAVGRAFMASPKVLLLDEPTEGLAPIIVEQMAREFAALCDRHKVSLILCEQNLWFARMCTSKLVLIDTGRFLFSGTWAEFDADASLKRYLAV